jgi:hypothetical protein
MLLPSMGVKVAGALMRSLPSGLAAYSSSLLLTMKLITASALGASAIWR